MVEERNLQFCHYNGSPPGDPSRMRWPLTVVPLLIVVCLFNRAAESQSSATLLVRNGRLIDGIGGAARTGSHPSWQ
jgi:hypothetical protein